MRRGAALQQPTENEPILDALYEGIVDPQALETALRLCMARLGASGVNIHVVAKDNLESLFFAGFGKGYTDETIAAYLDHWQYVNAHRDAMRRAYRPGEDRAFLCHEHISEADWARGGYFQDFFARLGQRWLAGGIAWSGRTTEVAIAFSRPAGSEPFGEDARMFITRLLPHVRRAARLAQKLGTPDRAGRMGPGGGLASARMPTFIVDGEGQVRWKNLSGEEFLKRSRGLLVKSGRLALADEEKDRELIRLIAAAAGKRLAETPPGLVRADDGEDALEVEVLPATAPAGALIGARSLATVMVRPIGLSPEIVGRLKDRHGLTDAECRLALALAGGASVEEAAAQGGVSHHTVRAQLRSIFAKTGVNRQSALAALIWKSA
jgi:DNA-binding CsgD family transcriptional regulator